VPIIAAIIAAPGQSKDQEDIAAIVSQKVISTGTRLVDPEMDPAMAMITKYFSAKS